MVHRIFKYLVFFLNVLIFKTHYLISFLRLEEEALILLKKHNKLRPPDGRSTSRKNIFRIRKQKKKVWKKYFFLKTVLL